MSRIVDKIRESVTRDNIRGDIGALAVSALITAIAAAAIAIAISQVKASHCNPYDRKFLTHLAAITSGVIFSISAALGSIFYITKPPVRSENAIEMKEVV